MINDGGLVSSPRRFSETGRTASGSAKTEKGSNYRVRLLVLVGGLGPEYGRAGGLNSEIQCQPST